MKVFASESLRNRIVRIPFPRDLYQGACPQGAGTPRNILLFPRFHRRYLLPKGSQRFQHHRFVLILNLKTAGSVAIDGQWQRFSPGEAVLVFPYQVHTFGKVEESSMCWLFLTFEQDSLEGMEILRQRIVSMAGSRPAELWLDLITEAWAQRIKNSSAIAHLAALLLGELQMLAAAAGPARKRRSPSKHSPLRASSASGIWKDGAELLLPAIHEIVEQKDPSCRIKDLARHLAISESHLRAEFRRQVGHSLGHYLKQIRTNRAASLLAGTSLRVGEIAERCGFDSLFSFSRFFRKAMGCSPRDYRKQAQG